MKNLILSVLLMLFIIPANTQELDYQVLGLQERAIERQHLQSVETLMDINPGFPLNWIQEYKSVELVLESNGTAQCIVGNSEVLSKEQRELLKSAELGAEINVMVKYVSDNTMLKSEVREIRFSYFVAPSIKAEFPYGYDELRKYLKESAIDKLDGDSEYKFQFAGIKFTVDEKGAITDVIVSQTSYNDKIDNILIEAIKNMPVWSPAQDYTGMKVKQEFEFIVGSELGC